MQDKPKYREDKPISCRYCYWWNDLKRQCGLKHCHYQIKTKKKRKMYRRIGMEIVIIASMENMHHALDSVS